MSIEMDTIIKNQGRKFYALILQHYSTRIFLEVRIYDDLDSLVEGAYEIMLSFHRENKYSEPNPSIEKLELLRLDGSSYIYEEIEFTTKFNIRY